jgi:DNA uptake protein ComE-like DNA-binding protein
MMDKRAGALAVAILVATAGDVLAECVDLNAASHERLTSIVHIGVTTQKCSDCPVRMNIQRSCVAQITT